MPEPSLTETAYSVPLSSRSGLSRTATPTKTIWSGAEALWQEYTVSARPLGKGEGGNGEEEEERTCGSSLGGCRGGAG